MADFVLHRVKFLPLIMSGCMLLSVTLPYIITIIQKKVEVFLPYISHAAAFPPQSALLSIFMAISAFLGAFTFGLRFVAVDHRRHRLEPRKIRILNISSMIVGSLACLAMLLASHFPVGFVTHEKFDWLLSVVIPHFVCTGLLLTLFTMYVLIQAYLTYVQRKRTTRNVFVHATLSMCVVITNWTSCLPFFAAMRDMLPRVVDSETGRISLESKEYNFYYIISSLSEWAFTFSSLLFIATFYRDFRHMKVSFKIKKKPFTMLSLDTVQPPPHSAFNGQHEEITKM